MSKRKPIVPLDVRLERNFCFYCDKVCVDLKALQDHMKAKHLQCQTCWKKMDSVGGLKVHHQSVHKIELQIIENALPERSDPGGPEIYLMEGVPQEMKDTFYARQRREYEQEVYERFTESGNFPKGTPEAYNQSKKAKVEHVSEEERKAKEKTRREAFVAQRRAEIAAKKKEAAAEAAAKEIGGLAEPMQAPAPEPMTTALHPPTFEIEFQCRPGYPVSMSPPQAGYPMSQSPPQQPFGYAGGPQYGYPPNNNFVQSPMTPAYAQPFGYAGSPQHSSMPVASGRASSAHQPPTTRAEAPSAKVNNPSPAAPAGLPQRPSFDAPSYSKEVMQKFHDGQNVSKLKSTGPNGDATSRNTSAGTSVLAEPMLANQAAPRYATEVPVWDPTTGGLSEQKAAKIGRQLDDLLSGGPEGADVADAQAASTSANVASPEPARDVKPAKQHLKVVDKVNRHSVVSPEERMAQAAKYTTPRKRGGRRGRNRHTTVVQQADSQAVTGSVADDLEQ